MASNEQIRLLLEEIGPAMDVQGVLQTDDGEWALIYDERRIVEITHSADRKCLTISTEVGEPEPERQLETYQSLLAYSAQGELTGGVRIALDSPYGSLLQLLDLFTEDLDRVTLLSVLENFVQKADAWHVLISEGGVSPGDIIESEESPPQGIRV